MRQIFFVFILVFVSAASFSQELTDAEVIKLFNGLRVADVSDGMDYVGLHDQGLLDQNIEALWKDIDDFSHMFCGIAMTVRYIPTTKEFPSNLRGEEYEKWRDHWYTVYSGEPFMDSIKKGSVVVIDNAGTNDVGSVGSNNSMLWIQRGAVGIVSNGGVRDTDEVIKQKIPTYLNIANRGRGIRPGRNELESVNQPIVIGGVTIYPGDLIVADGDGVIVVPRKVATDVARGAHEVLRIDKDQRRKLYEELGIPIDFTVE